MSLLDDLSTPSGDVIHKVFWCPGCKCAHLLDDRWTITGSADSPTVRASVLVKHPDSPNHPGGGRCHLFITSGKIGYLGDCTHDLKGKTIPMVDWNDV